MLGETYGRLLSLRERHPKAADEEETVSLKKSHLSSICLHPETSAAMLAV